MTAKLIQVIQVDVCRGSGTQEKPYYTAVEYWSVDGTLLAVRDTVNDNRWENPRP